MIYRLDVRWLVSHKHVNLFEDGSLILLLMLNVLLNICLIQKLSLFELEYLLPDSGFLPI
jgi:hypothetical protein